MSATVLKNIERGRADVETPCGMVVGHLRQKPWGSWEAWSMWVGATCDAQPTRAGAVRWLEKHGMPPSEVLK